MDQPVKNQGTIVQCIGAVVDVEFPRDQMPKIFDALKMDEIGLTLEVQQQLGDGVVRTIALGSSDGLRRGMQVVNTRAPIMVPVGPATLGRIMDVLGRPIDERGPVAAEKEMSIHRTAPAFDGGAALTQYTVTSTPGGKNCTTAGLSCTVHGLPHDTFYTFTVTATNSVGIGPTSAPSNAVNP